MNIDNEASKFSGARGRILLMDDEEIIRSYASTLLIYLGYSVETVSDGEEAVSLYTERKKIGQPFDIVILDLYILNGVGGEPTIRKLRDIDPGINAVVSSGNPESTVMKDFRKYGFRATLPKPYSAGQLREMVEAISSAERRIGKPMFTAAEAFKEDAVK